MSYERAYRERYDLDPLLAHVQREIAEDYGVRASFLRTPSTVLKFGANEDVDTGARELISEVGGDETLLEDNLINEIVSDNAADTQSVKIFGHTVEGSGTGQVFTAVTQEITLNGLTPVALTTPLARVDRTFNNSATEHLGLVTVYESGTAEVHISQKASDQQSFKAAVMVPNGKFLCVKSVSASVLGPTATSAVDVFVKLKRAGYARRTVYEMAVTNTSGTIDLHYESPIIVPPNTDFQLLAIATANNTKVAASFAGFYASEYQ